MSGTRIPDGLVLFRQVAFEFSLQPSYPLRVNGMSMAIYHLLGYS